MAERPGDAGLRRAVAAARLELGDVAAALPLPVAARPENPDELIDRERLALAAGTFAPARARPAAERLRCRDAVLPPTARPTGPLVRADAVAGDGSAPDALRDRHAGEPAPDGPPGRAPRPSSPETDLDR